MLFYYKIQRTRSLIHTLTVTSYRHPRGVRFRSIVRCKYQNRVVRHPVGAQNIIHSTNLHSEVIAIMCVCVCVCLCVRACVRVSVLSEPNLKGP